jgi:hypothetical protein
VEKRIAYSSTDDKIVDLEEYKKSPLHQQRLEEHVVKPKSRTETSKKKSKQIPGKSTVNKHEKINQGFKPKTSKPAHGKEYNMVAFLLMLAVLAALCLAIAFFIESSQPAKDITASAFQYLLNSQNMI